MFFKAIHIVFCVNYSIKNFCYHYYHSIYLYTIFIHSILIHFILITFILIHYILFLFFSCLFHSYSHHSPVLHSSSHQFASHHFLSTLLLFTPFSCTSFIFTPIFFTPILIHTIIIHTFLLYFIPITGSAGLQARSTTDLTRSSVGSLFSKASLTVEGCALFTTTPLPLFIILSNLSCSCPYSSFDSFYVFISLRVSVLHNCFVRTRIFVCETFNSILFYAILVEH